MTRVAAAARRTFDALHVYNYRLYFLGQIVSVSGTWMQSTAQAWLVLRLTHNNGFALGAVTATQFLPMLLLGPYGGVVADRVDKRRTLIGTQLAMGGLALILGLLTAAGAVHLWMVFALAFGLGLVTVVDNPTRQAFVTEMVGPDRLSNAVSLNSVVMNSARVIGPAVAGIVIATVSLADCFLANAASYLAVVAGLAAMRRAQLRPGRPAGRRPGQLKEGLTYVWNRADLRTPLLMMAVIGTLAYNFNVTLPLLAKVTFHAGADAFGALTSAMGVGAVIGGLITASRGKPTGRRLAMVAAAFGALIVSASLMPTLWSAAVALAVMGAFSIAFIATANTTLQLRSDPDMRGRVMALYAVAFLGSAPIGGPIVGYVGAAVGPRAALALGGVATMVAAVAGWRSLTGSAVPLGSLIRRAGPKRLPAEPVAAFGPDTSPAALTDGTATEFAAGDAVADEIVEEIGETAGRVADRAPSGRT